MRPSPKISMFSAVALLVCLLCGACALDRSYLRTELAEKSEIKGTCSVVFYGANYADDIATVAFIIPEGGQYAFDIFAPAFKYKTIKGLPAAVAVKMAERFVSWHPDFQGSQTSRILDVNGLAIGYEVRPLYRSTTFGTSDVMYVDYFLGDNNRVLVHIHLNVDVERKFMGGSGGHDSSR